MSRRHVGIRHEAGIEFAQAIRHYDAIEVSLGVRLQNDIADSIEHLAAAGFDGPPIRRRRDGRTFRRLLLSDFPYSIVYVADTSEVIVIAFAHTRRRPGYWLTRVK